MDTKAIEKFSIEAREQLLKDMEQQLYVYALDDAGRAEYAADADAIRGVVLSPTERAQRAELYRRIEREGTLPFITTMAYTWFNRFAAIRYMELAGHLPSHVRMLSASDGSCNPECLRVATTLDLPGLDQTEVARLIQAGDDEALYRAILIAQCNQLADYFPAVFGTVAADALTLPQNLLAKSEHNVLYRLVTDIPEDAWENVEILGWMYQFYNSAVKAEFFKSKRKAGAADIAPATQLFTPDWIVRYMVDNSLGRLWMLNHPESTLRSYAQAENPSDRLMEYYIEPDAEHEDFIRIANPEDITFCDPACGSSHILDYAFKMLMAIYRECGYREREIPALILTRNLSGLEIDERAAQIAQLALALCAREHDRRFFSRGITADIRVLSSIEIDADELSPTSPLRDRKQLLEDLAHLGEIGSLLQPTANDIAALEQDLVGADVGDLFSSQTNENVERALAACKALARRFNVVVANPPYMGSSSFNPFMSKWVKKHYPNSCKDLCTAFIERSYALAQPKGYSAMVTMQSWMFLGSFEKMREQLIGEKTILTMAHLGPRAFDSIGGEVVSVTADVLYNAKAPIKGAYARLVDINGSEPKREKLLEAIHNPDCGWFYRADAEGFHNIPRSPIAYWATLPVQQAFSKSTPLNIIAEPKQGMVTRDNDRFLRFWHEVDISAIAFGCHSNQDSILSGCSWIPITKGGFFRKWYGNNEEVAYWRNGGLDLINFAGSHIKNREYYFKPGTTWSTTGSAVLSMRKVDHGFIPEHKGSICYFKHQTDLTPCLAFFNSSICKHFLSILAPTIDFGEGSIALLPIASPVIETASLLTELANMCVELSKSDWDSQETSWDFKRNSLL